ncbi:MAG: efflux RND transporter periplasmic adaptor subunit [Muribaculaceae bacterium]|nr:efflux RND transporter periplasmic adaptor subunit [Muribaculaceae bacterium]
MKPINLILTCAAAALGAVSCSEGTKIELETYKVEPTSMSETVTATGTMESVTSVDVGTQVTGIIDKLYADYNDVVKKGQLLAELEKTTLDAELKSSDANVASAKSTYDYTARNYERDRALHDEKLISDYEFQTSRHDYEVAKLNYEKAQADRVRAAKNLNYTEIYSPIDGVVISREVEVGQTVVSSMNVANLYVIADLDNMQVVGNVDEADIGRVKEGQHVTFTVDAYTDDVFEGRVTQVRLNPTTTSNVVTYEVIVAASNPDHKLIPGMTANLTIYTLELNDVLAVPMKALQFRPQPQGEDEEGKERLEIVALKDSAQNSVWVEKGNRLVQTAVELGVNNSILQEITSGLAAGDRVAIRYNEIKKEDKGGTKEQNPFMPKPPGGNRKK